jgi:hypothetical protein
VVVGSFQNGKVDFQRGKAFFERAADWLFAVYGVEKCMGLVKIRSQSSVAVLDTPTLADYDIRICG